MIGVVTQQLILKDWQLFRWLILYSIAVGAAALAALRPGNEPSLVVGSVVFFISLILVGTILPFFGIVNERKNRNLAFVMSLPVSFLQYTTAKLISTLMMFLIPWLTLVTSAVLLIKIRGIFPAGAIPVTLILAFLPFLALCIITCAGLVGESEGWGIAANVVCNSSYGLIWYAMTRIPGLMAHASDPVPVWNSTVVAFLAAEFGAIVLILALTYYFQSRKRDFL